MIHSTGGTAEVYFIKISKSFSVSAEVYDKLWPIFASWRINLFGRKHSSTGALLSPDKVFDPRQHLVNLCS